MGELMIPVYTPGGTGQAGPRRAFVRRDFTQKMKAPDKMEGITAPFENVYMPAHQQEGNTHTSLIGQSFLRFRLLRLPYL